MEKQQPIITRYNPELSKGLSNEQVQERKSQGLVNKTSPIVGKTYFQIIVDNVFNVFNVLLFALAVLLIITQKYDSLFFLLVLIPNIGIGLYEDIHARRLMDKLKLVTQPKITVIREGQELEISTEDIVLDDIAILKNGAQIPADGQVISGNILVNESLLTGEPKSIAKAIGDNVFSGSFVVSGSAVIKVEKVGKDSYVETLQASAKKFKRSKSEILNALNKLFGILGGFVITLGIAMGILFALQGLFSNFESFKVIMGPISGSMISMIPSGLYLLTSVALATAVIRLSKENARVQDFYSVEMLARTNILCVDKTGTITDGTMTVQKIIPYGSYGEGKVTAILSDYVHLSQDNNPTAMALKNYFIFSSNAKAKEILDFNSDNKYSAITFESGETFVLGAADYINLRNKNGVILRVEEYARKGNRVIVLAKAFSGIKNGKVEGECEPLGMVVLQDHIRPDAIQTFRWFNENGVSIRVISGDDPQTVSEVARQAGILNHDKFISLAGMSVEEVKEIALNYTVFGRVTPEQKEALVMKLKEGGNTVAMTGDGVNDILALKRADCSIAMASGAEAAKNVSHIVLLDSNFDHLPSVVDQGRRVINNLQRTSSLFLVKTGFAIFFTVLFLLLGIITRDPSVRFPFLTNNIYIWESVCVGAPAFFLALEPNADRLKGTFFRNIFKITIPAATTIIVGVTVILSLYHLQKYGVMYTGVYTQEAAVAMSSIFFTIVAVFALLKVCLPFSKYRVIVFSIAAFAAVAGLVVAAVLSYTVGTDKSIFRIAFPEMSLVNYFETAIITTILLTIYLGITYIIKVLKGDHKNVKNKSRS